MNEEVREFKFLKGKGWIAQEFYNEYLELKEEICNLTYYNRNNQQPEYKEELEKKVKRMRVVLWELKNNNVQLEDLILLSLNVEL